MPASGLRELTRDLAAMGVAVRDLRAPFAELAARGAVIAAGLAPKRSGRLARSVRGTTGYNRATVSAGSSRVPYAGPESYGWHGRDRTGQRHSVQASGFIQKTLEMLAPTAEPTIRAALEKLIRERGLQ
jgi:hypothetical protein